MGLGVRMGVTWQGDQTLDWLQLFLKGDRQNFGIQQTY